MVKLTVYKIERETDPAYRYSMHHFADRNLWKIAYKKDDGKVGLSWAEGDDEFAALKSFKSTRLNEHVSVADKYEVVLGEE